jgi:hypothetical protein
LKFAKITFLAAGIWGVLALTPLYFIFDLVGRNDPPPITHPGFYYGFAGVALAWQIAFFIIAKDPVRFRPIMIPSMLEKIGFGGAAVVLYMQSRLSGSDLVLGCIDLFLASLFLVAFLKTPASHRV